MSRQISPGPTEEPAIRSWADGDSSSPSANSRSSIIDTTPTHRLRLQSAADRLERASSNGPKQSSALPRSECDPSASDAVARSPVTGIVVSAE